MGQDLLNIGEFARLAETTKRTVLWYEEKGVLKPRLINPENNYRLYSTDQIVELKAVMLLRRLNFSLTEIKKRGSLDKLFNKKRKALKEQITTLQVTLDDTQKYFDNLQQTGTLVKPVVKNINPLKVFCLDKTGPYVEIGHYYQEMRSYFKKIPKDTIGITVYEGFGGYQPRKAKIKICFVVKKGLEPKVETPVYKTILPKFKALTYTHRGSTTLLSILWKEFEKFRDKNDYKQNRNLSFEDLEFSYGNQVTEMVMPII